jgi:hypothetical protein
VTDQDDAKQAAATGSDGFSTGVTLAAVGLVMFFIWQSILNFVVLGGSEEFREVCASATRGHVVDLNRSAFPTQIWCETEADAYAGAVYSVWQSVGFTAVTVVLALVALYGVWMMVRRERTR